MNTRSLIIGLLLPLLLGCGTQETPAAEIAKPEMLGLSKQEVLTCLGQPDKRSVAGSVETWSIHFDTCRVDLTIADDGKVAAVTYNIKTVRDKGDKSTDDLPTEDEQCAQVPEVVSCARWLRH